jgi:hypothetical protein
MVGGFTARGNTPYKYLGVRHLNIYVDRRENTSIMVDEKREGKP